MGTPRIGQLFAKLEASPGTFEPLVAADVVDFVADQAGFTAGVGETLRRQVTRRHQDRLKALKPPGNYWDLVIQMEAKAQSADSVAPELARFLQASGMVESVASVTGFQYDWADNANAPASEQSLSLALEEDGGNTYESAGAKFGFEMAWGSDQQLLFTFTGMGGWRQPAATGGLTSVADGDYDSGEPLVCLHDTNPFLFHGYEMIMRSGSIQSGLTPEARPSMADRATEGYALPVNLNRGPEDHVTGSLEVEVMDETAFAAWQKFMAATGDAGLIVFADTSGHTLTINLHDVVFDAPQPSGGDLRLYTLPFTAARDGAGKSSLQLVWERSP